MLLDQYKHYFAELLHTQTNFAVEELLAMIEIPPENIPGDFAFPCFELAKQAKANPNTIAKQFAEKFSSPFLEKFEAVGGYLNAHIDKNDFIKDFFSSDIQHSAFNIQHSKPKVLIEYMSANPNKPLHIGQARNACIGDSMRRIYEYLKYDVDSCDYGDDSGVNIGYNIVGHLYYDFPVKTKKKFDHYAGEIYEKMRALATGGNPGETGKEDAAFQKRLSETLLKIEE